MEKYVVVGNTEDVQVGCAIKDFIHMGECVNLHSHNKAEMIVLC